MLKVKHFFKIFNDLAALIDLFLTNSPLCFQNTTWVFTGLSDFHKTIMTVSKTTFTNSKPREIKYRDYKAFNRSKYENELKQTLNNLQINTYDEFEKTS